MQQTIQLKASKMSARLWILQRVTSIGLIVVLLFHMVVLHYIDPSEEITLADTRVRLQSVLFIVVDSFLLAFALFHGLNGVRNVAYDYFPKPRTRKMISYILLVAGLATLVWGAFVLIKLVFPG